MWTFQRDSVPDELAALHVKEESWMKVWNYADSTIKKVMLLEAEKKKLQHKLKSPEVDISGFSTNNMDVAPGKCVSIVYLTAFYKSLYTILKGVTILSSFYIFIKQGCSTQ